MNKMKIDHIGYLVKNIGKAKSVFCALGFQPVSEVCRDEYRDVDICFLEKDGYTIELVSPFSDDSVVADLIKKVKNMPYHICYEVSDLSSGIADLRKEGFVPIGEPAPAPAFGMRRVCFLQSARIGMIELLESGKE